MTPVRATITRNHHWVWNALALLLTTGDIAQDINVRQCQMGPELLRYIWESFIKQTFTSQGAFFSTTGDTT